MLELYYNFYENFCDTDKYEELEMDTDCLYLALSEEKLEDVILPEKKLKGTSYVLIIALISLLRMLPGIFSPEVAIRPTRNMIKESRVSSKKSLDVQKCCVSSKTNCFYDKQTNKYKFSSKGLKKRTLEDCGDGPMSKYCKVLEESVNVTSTTRGFWTVQHSVAKNKQTKKGLSYFHPKRIVEKMENTQNPYTSKF